jgi:hypothetical protein
MILHIFLSYHTTDFLQPAKKIVKREFDVKVRPGNKMVRLARFERTTACLEGRCSIQLSYRRSLNNFNGQCASAQAQLRRQNVLDGLVSRAIVFIV